MTWFSWTSEAAFDEWHQQVVAELGLPRIGFNAQTGEPEPESQQTTAYTSAMQNGPDDWRAFVEPEVAEQFPEGLGVHVGVGWTVVDGQIVPPPAPEVEDYPEFTGDLL